MLILAGTPIGNLGDATIRLIKALENADYLAAEDTRVAGRLLAGLKITPLPRIISLHQHNERFQARRLVEWAKNSTVLLISDAGLPGISDPGIEVVRQAIALGVEVTALPGPSAFLMALVLSGLDTTRFVFEGFLPRKTLDRRRRLLEIADLPHTLIFYESPRRIAATLKDLAEYLGPDRPAALARELTKFHEEIRRSTLAQLRDSLGESVRGELCLVVSGALFRPVELSNQLRLSLDRLVEEGESLGRACGFLARDSGASRRVLYEDYLSRRKPSD